MCGSWRDVNPASFDFRLVGTEGFRADMLHLHTDVLQKCGQSGGRDLIAHVRWNRAGEGLACSNIELGAVHGAGNDLAVERTPPRFSPSWVWSDVGSRPGQER